MRGDQSYTSLKKALACGCGDDNSVADYLQRECGRFIDEEVTISLAAGSHTVNVFQLTGTVWIFDQWAEITEVTTLTNCTNMYSTLYDGTNTVTVTLDGASISGMPVGTCFSKTKDASQTYEVIDASQCRLTVPGASGKKDAYPFVITQKNGANTYLRLHLTTTDNPLSFKMRLMFTWAPLNGGALTYLL